MLTMSQGSANKRSRTRYSQSQDDEEDEAHRFLFSQQIPEASQSVLPERPTERAKLDNMDQSDKNKALTSLARHILFKALDREPIDRLKAIKDAGLSEARISNAAYQDVAKRFENVFGFSLKQTPPFMHKYKGFPHKFKDRYYLVNNVGDTVDGSHSKSIHSVHPAATIEKGVLILVVALIFCHGESRADGSRHILGRDLYTLMHEVDENIPEDPPAQGTVRANAAAAGNSRHNVLQGNSTTPNLDVMIENFVTWDYLIKDKATEENFFSQPLQDGDVIYSMGPRAALELGRKQIISFCAEVLGEEPDPTMLAEIEDDNNVVDQHDDNQTPPL